MRDDKFDYHSIRPLHTFSEAVGGRAKEQKPKVDIPDPPCGQCPHLHICSENEVACADFAMYVDQGYRKNAMVKHFEEVSPRLPLQELYRLIYREGE